MKTHSIGLALLLSLVAATVSAQTYPYPPPPSPPSVYYPTSFSYAACQMTSAAPQPFNLPRLGDIVLFTPSFGQLRSAIVTRVLPAPSLLVQITVFPLPGDVGDKPYAAAPLPGMFAAVPQGPGPNSVFNTLWGQWVNYFISPSFYPGYSPGWTPGCPDVLH